MNKSWQLPFDVWREKARSTNPLDRRQAESATNDLYALLDREPPWYVWCEGAFQLALMPSLFIAVVRSGIWKDVSAHFRDNVYPNVTWEPYRRRLEHSIIDATLAELLKDCKPCPDMTALIGALKEQLSNQLYRRARHEARSADDLLPQRLLRGTADRISAPHTTRYGPLMVRLDSLIGLMEAHFRRLLDQRVVQWESLANLRRTLTAECTGMQTVLSTHFQYFAGVLDEQWQSTLLPVWNFSSLAGYSVLKHWSKELNIEHELEELEVWTRFCQHIFACRSYEYVCFVSERPQTIVLNERARLHNADGPAIVFRDGLRLHATNGIAVRAHVVENPAAITVDEIECEGNIELRRILIDAYGPGRYIVDTDSLVIDATDYGTLYYKDQGPREEPLVMLKVRNSTPEPDGSYKDYFLRVPPRMRRAREAVAWTFGMHEQQYEPEVET